MINNLYSIGSQALSNAQVSVNTAANNIANADTVGYRRTETVYDTNGYIDVGAVSVGSGASVTEVQAVVDWFIEEQYLDSASELSKQNYLYDYLAQAESLLNQDEDSGLNAVLGDFWESWNAVASDPSDEAAREELLGNAELLIYEVDSTQSELEELVRDINDEIREQVSQANELIEGIATLNAQIVADQDNLDLINERDLMVEELAAIVDISVEQEDNGQVDIAMVGGSSLVEGGSCNALVYVGANADYSGVSGSTWDGEVDFNGTSSEEILLEFVSAGADGTAQFKVSLDGGQTWETDDSGNTLLYTADDASNSVEIEGVEIWFDGSGDHAVGDRVTIMPKSGVYWTPNDGDALYNVTTLTDDSGENASGRIDGGSLAGLLTARDDVIIPLMEDLDDLASAIIWETNLLHSQGAGLEHHTSLDGTYQAEDTAAAFAESGLAYAGNVEAGDVSFVTYDADGEVLTQAFITFDPATQSIDDLAAAINTAFAGELTATVNSDGSLSLASATDVEFEIAGDETGALAALGLNTFFTGSTAEDMGVRGEVLTDTAHVNCQVVESDGTVESGSNEIASAISELASTEVEVGDSTNSIQSFLSAMVADIGTASATAQLKQTYAATSVSYYEEQREAVSGVNVDEETLNLVKYQQQYEAAAQIIATAQEMFEVILAMF